MNKVLDRLNKDNLLADLFKDCNGNLFKDITYSDIKKAFSHLSEDEISEYYDDITRLKDLKSKMVHQWDKDDGNGSIGIYKMTLSDKMSFTAKVETTSLSLMLPIMTRGTFKLHNQWGAEYANSLVKGTLIDSEYIKAMVHVTAKCEQLLLPNSKTILRRVEKHFDELIKGAVGNITEETLIQRGMYSLDAEVIMKLIDETRWWRSFDENDNDGQLIHIFDYTNEEIDECMEGVGVCSQLMLDCNLIDEDEWNELKARGFNPWDCIVENILNDISLDETCDILIAEKASSLIKEEAIIDLINKANPKFVNSPSDYIMDLLIRAINE